MSAISESSRPADRPVVHRRRGRSQRRLRSVLFALGWASLLLGGVLLGVSIVAANGWYRIMGVVYVLSSVILLGAHAVLKELRRASRRKAL